MTILTALLLGWLSAYTLTAKASPAYMTRSNISWCHSRGYKSGKSLNDCASCKQASTYLSDVAALVGSAVMEEGVRDCIKRKSLTRFSLSRLNLPICYLLCPKDRAGACLIRGLMLSLHLIPTYYL